MNIAYTYHCQTCNSLAVLGRQVVDQAGSSSSQQAPVGLNYSLATYSLGREPMSRWHGHPFDAARIRVLRAVS